MAIKRDIELVINFVNYTEAEENDNRYYASLSAEEPLKECFDLRRLNYFDEKVKNLKSGKNSKWWIGKN